LEAFTAADAGGVPGAFQDIQQELVQDGLVASGAGIAHAHRRFTATWFLVKKKKKLKKINLCKYIVKSFPKRLVA